MSICLDIIINKIQMKKIWFMLASVVVLNLYPHKNECREQEKPHKHYFDLYSSYYSQQALYVLIY